MKTKRSTTSFSSEPDRAEALEHGDVPAAEEERHGEAESVIRLMYSAIGKRPKRMPPYSVW